MATGLVIVLVMTVVAYHRIQAASSGERISRREEGYLFAFILRLAGIALWAAVADYLFFPHHARISQIQLPTWLRWFGAFAGAGSAGLMYWTLSSLGKNLTDTVMIRERATLVTNGPYRWVRHPFYVTAAILMAAVSLLTASKWIAAASVVVLALLAIRTPKEEAMLVHRFGQSYRDYMKRTGRYFPRL